MQYKDMKTLTTLLQPTETGWQVMHKKFKMPYGTVVCTETGDAVNVEMRFGANAAAYEEAAEAVLRFIFEESEAQSVTLDGDSITRDEWQAVRAERFAALRKTPADYADVLGAPVHCVMDRPLGSAHPRYPEMIYPVNYGYVPGRMAGDNSEQDVYILGPTEPLECFDGVVIAVIHRFDDCEDKWVVAEKAGLYTEEEIRAKLDFQERYYISEIIM